MFTPLFLEKEIKMKMIFIHKGIVSSLQEITGRWWQNATKILLRDGCCDITVPNKLGPSQDKSGDTKDRFYEEVEQLFDHCPKYNMKFLFGEFNAKLGREHFQADNWE